MSYFTIEEQNQTAKALDIDNTPPEDVKRNLEELIDILNGIREGWTILCKEKGWGKASIIVGSGYRCPKLNVAIKGVYAGMQQSLKPKFSFITLLKITYWVVIFHLTS